MRLNLSLYFLCEINRVVSKYCSWSTVCKEMCFYLQIPFFHLAALLPAASASLCIFLITLPQRWAGLRTIQQGCWSIMFISAWHLPLCRGRVWVCSALNLLFQHSPSQELLRSCPCRETEVWEQLPIPKSFHQRLTYLRIYFGIVQDDLLRSLPTSANL